MLGDRSRCTILASVAQIVPSFVRVWQAWNARSAAILLAPAITEYFLPFGEVMRLDRRLAFTSGFISEIPGLVGGDIHEKNLVRRLLAWAHHGGAPRQRMGSQ